MKKIVIFLVALYPCMMLAGLVWVYQYDIATLHKTVIEMDSSLNSANNYCVKQAQDIEGMQKRMSEDAVSRNNYENWLKAMGSMQQIKFFRNGSTSVTSMGSKHDEVFKERYLKKLNEEEHKPAGEGMMTPLNFGITYLDRQQLEMEATWYMYKRVMDLNDRFAFGKLGLYRIDPNTIKVEVELTATPINLEDMMGNTFVKDQYLKLFGSNTAKDSDTSQSGRVMSNVIVVYDIDYYLYYDYISSSPFLKVPKKELDLFDIGASEQPPADIYFPFWYTRDGELNPDKDMRLSSPVRKFKLIEPIKHSYSFVLTN